MPTYSANEIRTFLLLFCCILDTLVCQTSYYVPQNQGPPKNYALLNIGTMYIYMGFIQHIRWHNLTLEKSIFKTSSMMSEQTTFYYWPQWGTCIDNTQKGGWLAKWMTLSISCFTLYVCSMYQYFPIRFLVMTNR